MLQRDIFIKEITNRLKTDKSIFFLSADFGAMALDELREKYPNNFLHCKVIEYGIINNFKYYHLGGGLKNNDSLYKFKLKISDTKFNYNIYKNILNVELYEEINKLSTNEFFPKHIKHVVLVRNHGMLKSKLDVFMFCYFFRV